MLSAETRSRSTGVLLLCCLAIGFVFHRAQPHAEESAPGSFGLALQAPIRRWPEIFANEHPEVTMKRPMEEEAKVFFEKTLFPLMVKGFPTFDNGSVVDGYPLCDAFGVGFPEIGSDGLMVAMEIFAFHPLAVKMRSESKPLPDLEHALGGWVVRHLFAKGGRPASDKFMKEVIWTMAARQQQYTVFHSASWTSVIDALARKEYDMFTSEGQRAFWDWYMGFCPHYGSERCTDADADCKYDGTMYWNCVHPVGHGFVTILLGDGHDVCKHSKPHAIDISPMVLQTSLDWCHSAPTKTAAAMCVMGAMHHYIKRASTPPSEAWLDLCEIVKSPYSFWCGGTVFSVDGDWDLLRVARDLGMLPVAPPSSAVVAGPKDFDGRLKKCLTDELASKYGVFMDLCNHFPNPTPYKMKTCVTNIADKYVFIFDLLHADCYWRAVVDHVAEGGGEGVADLERLQQWYAGNGEFHWTEDDGYPFFNYAATVGATLPPIDIPPSFYAAHGIPMRKGLVDQCTMMVGGDPELWLSCIQGTLTAVWMMADLYQIPSPRTLQVCAQFSPAARTATYAQDVWQRAETFCASMLSLKKAPFPGAETDWVPGDTTGYLGYAV